MKNFLILLVLQTFLLGEGFSQSGCSDPLASNYDPLAVVNDGSCLYPFTTQTPTFSVPIPDTIMESSGLLWYNQRYWSQNDDTDPNWYALDSLTGLIIDTLQWTGLVNFDWEEIQQNDQYFFIGDIGNNSGNRTDLKFFRIPKTAVNGFDLSVVDTIAFHYEDQLDFNNAANDHDFDCEAFLVDEDSIYLFTKCWASQTTSLYTFPNTEGEHAAIKRATWNAQGMITGAHRLSGDDHIALVGYTELLQPFMVLLYDFQGTDFLGANKRKISLGMPFHQMEAVCSADGLHYYLTNEKVVQGFTVPAQWHHWDATSFLVEDTAVVNIAQSDWSDLHVFPNPVNEILVVSGLPKWRPLSWRLLNERGALLDSGLVWNDTLVYSMLQMDKGIYFLELGVSNRKVVKVVHQ